MSLFRPGRLDALRGAIAGSRAVALRASARVLFESGGRRVLPATVQQVVRGAVEREAARVLAVVGVASRAVESGAPSVVVRGAAAASRQVLRGVGSAAAAGALVDGGWAFWGSVRKVRAGTMTRRQAAAHIAREAGSGAAATAAGTAAAALLIAVTGGVATPALFAVAAVASMGAKAGLDAWMAKDRQPERSYAQLAGGAASAGSGGVP